ncbi:hypothetical protein FJY84_08120 [Candidatus Bathyarchaeota archaeon]|nr:hypothetical protein [Candidatus Bathyarchaeota archaeon]
MKLKSLILLTLLLAIFLVISIFPLNYSQSLEEKKPLFIFIVSMGTIDWGTQTIEAPLYILFGDLPDTFKEMNQKGELLIDKIGINFEQWHNVGQFYLYPAIDGSKITFRGSSTDNRFDYRGPSELYPYDSYMLNITFTMPSLGLINENNIIIKPEVKAAGFIANTEERSDSKPFTLNYLSNNDKVSLNFVIYLRRAPASTDLFMQVLIICFLLVGSIPLIKPDKIENRLSICLSLFLFSVTFTFNLSAPTLNRASLAESLTFILLTGAGAYSVISVIERALFEAVPKTKNLRFLFEGLVVFILLNTLQGVFNSMVTPSLSTNYPWVSVPSGLLLSLSLILGYGYVIVIISYLINSIRKKMDSVKK